MSTQLLVNVFRVPAGVGDLAVGDSVTLPHGLFSNEEAVRPTLIQPNLASTIVVETVTDTDVTFRNLGAAPANALFRCERGLSNELDADVVTPSYWQGAASGGGGGTITAIAATAPIAVATPGGPIPTVSIGTTANFALSGANLDLSSTGVVANPYGDLAAANQTVVPTFTVDAKGRITTANSGAIKIGGSDAKTYVDTQDAATLAAANLFAESLAFGISSKEPAHVATDVALPSYVATTQTLTASVNGLFPTVDGEGVLVGQRVLVKNETAGDAPNNGIYVLTDAGSLTTKWVLTRANDANTASELCGSIIPVETGTQAGTVWIFAANSTTFVLGGSSPANDVLWVQLTVGSATTTSQGIVQLAGGLGGAGTTASAPKLDMGSATSGTLLSNRGGTGESSYIGGDILQGNGGNLVKLPAAGPNQFLKANGAATALSYASVNLATADVTGTLPALNGGTGQAGTLPLDVGKVLTADGAGGWSVSSVPSTNTLLAQTYYVTSNGSDAPIVGDGSIAKPFASIQHAIDVASLAYASSTYVQIIVGPGTYSAPLTINRLNTFIIGSGPRPEDQGTRITVPVAIDVPAGGSLYNDQIAISGCFIQSSVNSPALEVLSPFDNPCTITVTNSYLTTNNAGANAPALQVSNTAVKMVLQNTTLTVQGATVAAVVVLLGSDVKFSDGQILRSTGAGRLIFAAGGSLFLDRQLMETNVAGAPIIETANPSAPLAYKLIVANSSITSSVASAFAAIVVNCVGTTSYVTNTDFGVARVLISVVAGTVKYSNLTSKSSSVVTISGAGAQAETELHGNMFLPWSTAPLVGEYRVLTVDSNKQVQTLAQLPASNINAIPYDVSGSIFGQWSAAPDNTVFLFKATRAFTLSATAANHKFAALTASTGTPTFTLYKNTTGAGNEILTAQFNASTTGTVTMSGTVANYSLAADDVLILMAPVAVDGTLADIFWTLSATLP